MRFFSPRSSFALMVLLVLFSPVAALAGLAETVARDFKPLTGVVVLPVEGQYIIDLDASSGVAIGDLFCVVKSGENIVHPVTGVVLGKLDEVKAVLQVVRVKSGYSYVRALDGASGIGKGETVRRYEQLPATFWDYTGQGEATYAELKNALPLLEWQDFRQAQMTRPETAAAPAGAAAGLTFVYKADRLLVHGPDFQVIRSYPVAVSGATSGAAPAAMISAPAGAAVPPTIEARLRQLEQQAAQGSSMAPKGPYQLDAAPVKSGLQFEAMFPGYKNLGNLAGVTNLSDFARYQGQLLLAATNGQDIKVYAVTEPFNVVAEGDTGYIAQILSVQWWQPSSTNKIYLAASTWDGKQVQSAIFEFQNNQLRLVDQNIPYLLGSFDRDGNGSNELLMGQGYSVNGFFGGDYYQVDLTGGKVTAARLAMELPRRFPVQGSLFADVTGDGQAETLFVRDNLLYIYQGDRQVYKSPKIMGGSLSIASYETNVNNPRDSVMDYTSFDVRPLAFDLDGDGVKEIVAVASERSPISSPGIGPGVQKSWLAVIKYRDNMFVKGTLGGELEMPIQGLAIENNQVLFVASEPASILGDNGGSHLLVYPLK